MLFIFISYLLYLFITTILVEYIRPDNIYVFIFIICILFSKLTCNSYIYYQLMSNMIENHDEKFLYDIKKLFISNGFFTIIGIICFLFFEQYHTILLFDFCLIFIQYQINHKMEDQIF